jgi:macrophage erythroblast attacher
LEEAKRVARQTQRVLEKEWKVLKEADKLPLIIQKVQALREQELGCLELARKRQEYIERVLEEGGEEYMRVKYYRLLVDYLARKGDFALAQDLARAINITVILCLISKDFVDIKVFEEYHFILGTLREKQSTAEALQWCSDNRSHLKKTGSKLEFLLRRQDLLDLVRQGKKGPAVLYAKKHLTSMAADESMLSGIQQALAMLIAPRRTQHLPYQELAMEGERWEEITRSFKQAYFGLYGLTEYAPLLALVQMGCAAFKTAACTGGSSVLECPACNVELAPLVKPLPFAHFEYSRLYCRLSKKLMTDDNPPYALPNGQIYSSEVFINFIVILGRR